VIKDEKQRIRQRLIEHLLPVRHEDEPAGELCYHPEAGEFWLDYREAAEAQADWLLRGSTRGRPQHGLLVNASALKKLRKHLGYTQDQFADECNVGWGRIRTGEAGGRLEKETLHKILDFVNSLPPRKPIALADLTLS